MKHSFFYHALFFCTMIFLAVSCKDKDDETTPVVVTLAEQINGDWDVTSWTNDGTELMRSDNCTDFTMDYDFKSDDGGDFSWAMRFANQPDYTRQGTYTLDEDDQVLKMTYTENGANGQQFIRAYDIEFIGNGDKIEISTVINDKSVIIKAKRD
jgi:hypothetical protein